MRNHNRNNEKHTSQVICVLGMHRSGTSMMMRLLNVCGVYIGDESVLYPPGKGNPKGHWEHEEVIEINQAILEELEYSIYEDFSFPDNWKERDVFKKIIHKAKIFVDQMNAESDVWGFKDPRTCLTLPFWQEVISNMRYVIMVRDAESVAKSLYARDGRRLIDGELYWAHHWIEILRNTSENDRIFVVFDRVLSDWKGELTRVLRYINIDGLTFVNKKEVLESFVDVKLKHYKSIFYFVPPAELEEQINGMIEYIQTKKKMIKQKNQTLKNLEQYVDEQKELIHQRERQLSTEESELNKVKGELLLMQNSKTFKLGILFFESIKKPHKLIMYPYNFIQILFKK